MKTNIIIIGAGGHATTLIDCLYEIPMINILGILDTVSIHPKNDILGIKVLGGEEQLAEFRPHAVQLVNAIGSVDIPLKRTQLFQKFKEGGYHFYSVIHPSAYVGRAVKIGEGVQIMAGSVIQPNCFIGDNTIINTGATIDHDCHIDEHVHISPGVKIAGNVKIEKNCHIGIGSVVIQGLTIQKNTLIGAGSVVIHSIGENARVAGVPAKNIKEDCFNGQLEKYIT